MVYFHYNLKEHLIIRVTNDFSHLDTERIALLLEGSYCGNFDKVIAFQVESDLPKEQMKLLDSFCERLPYAFQIDLKYPLLLW